MTEAPVRHHDLHRYATLAPDWLTQHEPRTVEHTQEHPDGSVSLSLMSEIGDGTFVAWSTCVRCTKHYTSCPCPEGPKEPAYIGEWRNRRFSGSFDTRPDLPAGRDVVTTVLAALKERGYVIGEIPPPERVEVTVPDHSLFVALFQAVAACEAPEESQLDEVLGDFQERYDAVAPKRPSVEDTAVVEGAIEDDLAFARDTLGEDAPAEEVQELAEQRADRDLKEIHVDF